MVTRAGHIGFGTECLVLIIFKEEYLLLLEFTKLRHKLFAYFFQYLIHIFNLLFLFFIIMTY